jgi:hypothetical protein
MSQPDVAHLVPGGKAFPPKVLRDLTGFGEFLSVVNRPLRLSPSVQTKRLINAQ